MGLTVSCGIASNTALFSAAYANAACAGRAPGAIMMIRAVHAAPLRQEGVLRNPDVAPQFAAATSGEEEQWQRNEPTSLRKSNELARMAFWSACVRGEDAPSSRRVARKAASVLRLDAAATISRARLVTCRPLLSRPLLPPVQELFAGGPSARHAGSSRSASSRRCWQRAAPGRSVRHGPGCR